MTVTPNLLMTLPTPGFGGTPGPEYATLNNEAFEVIDAHDHTEDKGKRITVAALNLNADVPFNGFNATALKSTRYTAQLVVLAGPNDRNAVYSVNGDLYWNNASGTPVQLTSGTGINIASTGTIGGDYGQPGVQASAIYSNTLKAFIWTQSAGVVAKMNVGDLQLQATQLGAQPVTLKAGAATTSYDLTLPVAAPANDTVLTFDATGQGTHRAVLGTTNQVAVTPTASAFTLTLPQNIHTGATPTFAGLTTTGSVAISGATSDLTVGRDATVTTGLTVGSRITLNALTAGQAVVTDGSKNLASLAYSTAANALQLVQRDSNGDVFANVIRANSFAIGNIESGFYDITFFSLSNLSITLLQQAHYIRVGNHVQVAFNINIQSAAAGFASGRFTLPFTPTAWPDNNATKISGVVSFRTTETVYKRVPSIGANSGDTLGLLFVTAAGLDNYIISVTLTYRIA